MSISPQPVPAQAASDVASPMAEPVRVLLADDHELARGSVRRLLDNQEGIDVVGEARNTIMLNDHLRREPHVLVFHIGQAGTPSLDTIRRIAQAAPRTGIVVLTTEDDAVFARHALEAGALGFVSKAFATRELPQAVRAAARGERYLSPGVAGDLYAVDSALIEDELTMREVEILRLIALGHTSVEIAHKLHLSPRTVETHRARIHKKLKVSTRAELVRYALNRGLLRP